MDTEKAYTLTIADQRLHYRVIGQGTPLVLIHGFGVSGYAWQWMLPYLAQRHELFIVDLPGYGRSTFRPPWRVRDMAPILATWLGKMDLSSVALMGHSMGGAIAVHLAASAPELVEQLILLNAAALPLNTRLPELSVRFFLSSFQAGGRFPLALVRDVLQPRPQLFWQAMREMMHSDFRNELASLTIPTLIIWGKRDLFLPHSLGQALAAALPHAIFVTLPDAGHRPNLAQPKLLSRIVLDFLAAMTQTKSQPS